MIFKKEHTGDHMEYSSGDKIKFRLKSGGIQEGEVLFIEKNLNGNMLYINGFNRMAYRIHEKMVISLAHEEKKSVQLKRRTSPERALAI